VLRQLVVGAAHEQGQILHHVRPDHHDPVRVLVERVPRPLSQRPVCRVLVVQQGAEIDLERQESDVDTCPLKRTTQQRRRVNPKFVAQLDQAHCGEMTGAVFV
jgi:hypothetical protein